jgi:hypothetical protein
MSVQQPPRKRKRKRCNFYFGGFDGGNRCQLSLGHCGGHHWQATKEPKPPKARRHGE